MRAGLPTGPPIPRLTKSEGRRLERVERLANLLDNAVLIPGTRFRIGLDPLVGLVPGLGDALGALASCWILIEAARFGVPGALLLRMLYNIAIDTAVGTVPGAGDLFDFVWKSDVKNVRLLRRHLEQPEAVHRASRLLLIAVLALVALLSIGSIVGGVLLVRYLLSLATPPVS